MCGPLASGWFDEPNRQRRGSPFTVPRGNVGSVFISRRLVIVIVISRANLVSPELQKSTALPVMACCELKNETRAYAAATARSY